MLNVHAENISQSLSFIVRNISSKKIRIFNHPIEPGTSKDLGKIEGITEDDIKISLSKGLLRRKLIANEISVTSTNVDLISFSASHQSFLNSKGISTGVVANAGGSVLTVANLSALAALSDSTLTNGTLVYVETLKDYFGLDKTSTLTVNSPVIIATNSGTGRWSRKLLPNNHYSNYQNWYINASTGNDENDGYTSLTPIKTLAELNRRIKSLILLPFSGTNLTINLLSNFDITDPLIIDITIGTGVVFKVQGQRTVLRTSSLTGVTAINSSTNSAQTITDSTLTSSWTPYLNKLLVITSGANTGIRVWIDKDLGSNQARTTTPVGDVSSNFFISEGSLSVSDPYQIVDFTQCYLGKINIKTVNMSSTDQYVLVDSVEFLSNGVTDHDTNINVACRTVFHEVRFNSFISTVAVASNANSGDAITYLNCASHRLMYLAPCTGNTGIWGGLFKGNGLVVLPAARGFMIWGPLISGAFFKMFPNSYMGVSTKGIPVFDQPINVSTFGPILIDENAVMDAFGSESLWGSNNGGYGLIVLSGGIFKYANTPTITATLGNFKMGALTSVRTFDNSTGDYTTARTCTWANLAAAIGSGGFGGSIVNPQNGANIVKNDVA